VGVRAAHAIGAAVETVSLAAFTARRAVALGAVGVGAVLGLTVALLGIRKL
jgi:hypothetical protein